MTKKKPGAKMGRPRKELNPANVEALAELQCTFEEIAFALGVSVDTLDRRREEDPAIADAIGRGRAKGRESLRRHQWDSVEKGSVPMQKFLGANWLGQTEKSEVDATVTERKQIVIHRKKRDED